MSQWNHSVQGSMNYTRRRVTLRYDADLLARVEAVAGPAAVAAMSGPSGYSEVHRRVGDEVKVTTCCCAAAGATAKECQVAKGTKTRCACYCHSRRISRPASPARGKEGK